MFIGRGALALKEGRKGSLYTWSDVLFGDHEVVEEDDVDGVLRPAVGDVAFEGEGVGMESGAGAPVDAHPMAPELAVDPEGLLAVWFPWGVFLQHEFAADPLAACDVLLGGGAEGVAPVFFIRGGRHFVPIRIEVPFSGRRIAAPIAPGFEGGGKAIVAVWQESGSAEAAPTIASLEAFVGAQGYEVVDVIAFFVEAGIEAHEEGGGRLEPFGQSSSCIFDKFGANLEAAFADRSAWNLDEAEDGFLVAGLVPSGPEGAGFKVVGKEDGLVGGDALVALKGGGEAFAVGEFAGGGLVGFALGVAPGLQG